MCIIDEHDEREIAMTIVTASLESRDEQARGGGRQELRHPSIDLEAPAHARGFLCCSPTVAGWLLGFATDFVVTAAGV